MEKLTFSTVTGQTFTSLKQIPAYKIHSRVYNAKSKTFLTSLCIHIPINFR